MWSPASRRARRGGETVPRASARRHKGTARGSGSVGCPKKTIAANAHGNSADSKRAGMRPYRFARVNAGVADSSSEHRCAFAQSVLRTALLSIV